MLALLTTTSLVGDIFLPTGWNPSPGVFPKSHQAELLEARGLLGGSLGREGCSEGSRRTQGPARPRHAG